MKAKIYTYSEKDTKRVLNKLNKLRIHYNVEFWAIQTIDAEIEIESHALSRIDKRTLKNCEIDK